MSSMDFQPKKDTLPGIVPLPKDVDAELKKIEEERVKASEEFASGNVASYVRSLAPDVQTALDNLSLEEGMMVRPEDVLRDPDLQNKLTLHLRNWDKQAKEHIGDVLKQMDLERKSRIN